MTTKFAGHAASAVLLLWAGRRDWRTWLLGIYCLLKATQAPLLMLQAFVLELPPPPEYAAFLSTCPAPTGSSLPSTFPRSCSRRRSCGRSLASAHRSISGPGSMIWRAA